MKQESPQCHGCDIVNHKNLNGFLIPASFGIVHALICQRFLCLGLASLYILQVTVNLEKFNQRMLW